MKNTTISDKQLAKLILDANTTKKAVNLVNKIQKHYTAEKSRSYLTGFNNGIADGRNQIQGELRALLNAKEDTHE